MMAFQLHQPRDIDIAIGAASSVGAKYIAGGTDLMQLMKDNVEAHPHIVDLDGLVSDAVAVDATGLHIGAGAKMSDVGNHPDVIRSYPVISQALLASASPQVRNMATMGGNLLQRARCGYFRDTGFPCNKRVPGSGCPAIRGENRNLAILGTSQNCIASNPSDLAVALVALDAVLELRGLGGATRKVALTDFHLEPGDTPHIETVLQPGEIITAIFVPASNLTAHSVYVKVRDRASFEWAVVSAAVALDTQGGTIKAARVAMGGVGTKPWRAKATEAALVGQSLADTNLRQAAARATDGATPHSQNGFKAVLAQRTVVRALQSVA